MDGRAAIEIKVAHDAMAGALRHFKDKVAEGVFPGGGVADFDENFFKNPGHGGQHMRPDVQEVLLQGQQAFGVINGYPQMKKAVVARHALKDMAEGQNAQCAIAFLGPDAFQLHFQGVQDIARQIAMGEHHALGIAGGAGRINEREQIIWALMGKPLADFGSMGVQGLAVLHEAFPCVDALFLAKWGVLGRIEDQEILKFVHF